MFVIVFIFLALGIVSSLIFIIFRSPKPKLYVVLMKTLASLFFVATGLAASTFCGSYIYSLLFISGGIFGLLGDIWLDFKWIYPYNIEYYLYGGFIFFMLGHVCYSAAIMIHYRFAWYDVLICLAVAGLFALLVQIMKKPLGLDMTGYNIIATLYTAVISVPTAASVISMKLTDFNTSAIITTVGMLAFFASDFVLSGTYFGKGQDTKPYIVLNHSLYYFAQYAMALSIYFIV